MYKRFTIQEIKTIQNNFIQNLYGYIKKERCQTTIDFFKKIFKEGDDIYFCNRSDIMLSCSKSPEWKFIIRDEREKIELILDDEGKRTLESTVRNYITKKERQIGQKTIEQILMEEFKTGAFSTINGKPYLVYDIETTVCDNIKDAEYLLWYAMYPVEDNKMEYEYIGKEDIDAFVKKMIDFDGYIIGYNNIWFDNPVCIYNTTKKQEDIDILNSKTIDLFVFLQKMTGKRIGLNKVATALVSLGKTLESGAEGEVLWKQYLETKDNKFLEEFKKYCKNDVRMTALVLLYLLHYKKISMEGDEIQFSIEDFLENSNGTIKDTNETAAPVANLFS